MGNAENKAGSYGYRVIKVAPGSPAQQVNHHQTHSYFIGWPYRVSRFHC